jgi:hypothetical protein
LLPKAPWPSSPATTSARRPGGAQSRPSSRARSISARDRREGGGSEASGRAAVAGEIAFGCAGGFDEEEAGGDEGGDFGVAEPFEETEDVAVEGFFPDPFPGFEVTADRGGGDPRVEGGGVEREAPAFAPAEDADRTRSGVGAEGVDAGEDGEGFVAGEGAAHFEGGAVEELAVVEVAAAGRVPVDLGFAGVAVDEGGDEDAAAAFGEAAGELGLGSDAGGEAGELFGGQVGVGEGDDVGDGDSGGRLQEQALGVDVPEGGPADGVDADHGRGADEGGLGEGGDEFDGRAGGAGFGRAEDAGELGAPGGEDRFAIGRGGAGGRPVRAAGGGGIGELSIEETVGAGDEIRGEVAREFEGGGTGEGWAVGGRGGWVRRRRG